MPYWQTAVSMTETHLGAKCGMKELVNSRVLIQDMSPWSTCSNDYIIHEKTSFAQRPKCQVAATNRKVECSPWASDPLAHGCPPPTSKPLEACHLHQTSALPPWLWRSEPRLLPTELNSSSIATGGCCTNSTGLSDPKFVQTDSCCFKYRVAQHKPLNQIGDRFCTEWGCHSAQKVLKHSVSKISKYKIICVLITMPHPNFWNV